MGNSRELHHLREPPCLTVCAKTARTTLNANGPSRQRAANLPTSHSVTTYNLLIAIHFVFYALLRSEWFREMVLTFFGSLAVHQYSSPTR